MLPDIALYNATALRRSSRRTACCISSTWSAAGAARLRGSAWSCTPGPVPRLPGLYPGADAPGVHPSPQSHHPVSTRWRRPRGRPRGRPPAPRTQAARHRERLVGSVCMWASALKLKNVGGERAADRAHARVPPGLRRREREQVRMFGRMIMLPARGGWPKGPKPGTDPGFK